MTDEDEWVCAERDLPRIAELGFGDDFDVTVTWRSGSRETINLAPAIFSHRHFGPLRHDRALFRAGTILDAGSGIIWPGDIVLSADWLDRLPRSMESAELLYRLRQLSMDVEGMAHSFQLARYAQGEPIPTHVALAIRALANRQAS